MDVVAGLISAAANSVGSILSKDLTGRFPARQLIAPLLALNVLLVLPLAPFVTWSWSPQIIALHVLSATVLSIMSLGMFDLFEHGSASAAVTAQAISPLPAALGVALLLPGTLGVVQSLAAVIVVGGVLVGLSGSFAALGRRRTALTVAVVAVGVGLLTVLGRLIADAGAGPIEAYLVRAGLATVMCGVLVPPRDIPLRALPAMLPRALFVSIHFLAILLAVQRGNPAVVQTAAATVPLFTVAIESVRTRRTPAGRVVASAGLALVGVAIVLLG